MKTIEGHEVHYVEFLSPGTLFSESTRMAIDGWDIPTAVIMAKTIKERHGASPYGFRFQTFLEAGPVQVQGQELKVEPKSLRGSGIYFITGSIRSAAEILEGTDPKEEILRANVKGNDIPAIIENRNSYLTTLPFEKDSVLVDWDGKILQAGLEGLEG